MIKYLSHNEINKSKWNSCIKDSVNGLIYAYSWYLDIVCPGWNALVEDDYKSVMPLAMGEKYGFKYIYPPPFTQQLGVFSTSGLSNEHVERFLKHIPADIRYVEMNMNTLNRAKPSGFENRHLVTHLLDLIPTYDQLASNYSTQTKRNLKKAGSYALDVTRNLPPEKIIDLFRNNRGKKYGHPLIYYRLLHKLMLSCIEKNLGQCWGVYNVKKELCAGAFFIGSNKRVVFLFSGVNELGYEAQAMTFLLNRFIESNAQRDIVMDFEGSMDKDIARFYKGFGSQETQFMQIRRNTLPGPVKWLKEIQFRRKNQR